MAQHKSAEKRIRQTVKHSAINRARMSRVKTFVNAVEDALTKGDKAGAEKALKAAEPEMQRGARKGVIHKNAAARKISRLSKRIRAL